MGLKTSFDVVVEGKSFVIEAVSNFDIRSVDFEDGSLVFDIKSSLQNNFGELQIPKNITKGTLKFYLDEQEIQTKVLQNDRISFVTLEFAGNGTHTLVINSDFVTEEPKETLPPENFDQLTVIIAVSAIIVAVAIGGSVAFIKMRAK
jgi:hypothetical protein